MFGILDEVSLRLHLFFSSRRRHTRWPRDWSSDVGSSDLDYLSTGSSGLDASLNFNFIQSGAAAQITLLYANAPANMSAYGTQIGLYNVQNPAQKLVLFDHGTLYNPAPGSNGIYNNDVSPQSPFSVSTFANYGLYANTCGFRPNGSIYCDTYYSNTS